MSLQGPQEGRPHTLRAAEMSRDRSLQPGAGSLPCRYPLIPPSFALWWRKVIADAAAQSPRLDAPLPAMRVLLTSTLLLLLFSAASALHASSLRVTPQRARARSITMMPIGVPKVNTRAPPEQNVG